MARYIYPVFESTKGTYYGTCASLRKPSNKGKLSVMLRFRELLDCRKERTERQGGAIESRTHFLEATSSGDVAARMVVTVTEANGKQETEVFTAYRDSI